MILKIIDWKAIWKFCVTIICGLHFGRISRISCKNMMKDVTQLTFTCSKSAIETLEKSVKHVQS